jgi:hypothetical protein
VFLLHDDIEHLATGVGGEVSASMTNEFVLVGEHETCREIATNSAGAIEVSRA